jgi:hypothetical protein
MQTGGPLPPRVLTGGVQTGGPLPPQQLPQMNTGGPLPPQQVPGMNTGGPLPPQQVPGMSTGGPLPPQVRPPLGGDLRPRPVPPGAQAAQPQSFAAGDVVSQIINGMMNGEFGKNAERRGLELANQRGLLNSSMSAGNARRAALEGITPFVNSAMGLLGQREGLAFQGEQAQMDRDLKSKLQSDATFQQDWLSSQSFNREFYAAMAMVPVQNASQFQQMIAQYALDNPEVYTPQTIAGMTQFFNSNFQQIMAQYMPRVGG